jgi:predicted MFS family arabinose efflux permease
MAIERNVLQASLWSQLNRAYVLYVLVMLTLVGACSWTDRLLFSILLQPIKGEFNLTDTELGLLGGTAFGLLNVTLALPIAALADRTSRRRVISVAMAVWSMATFLCGLCTGYASLFACRMVVGIGEAGCSAPSQSLASDYVPERYRALAMGAIFSFVPIGYLISYSLGGWLSDSLGWRSAFAWFGIPGLFLAALFQLTVREPARNGVHRNRDEVSSSAFWPTLRYLLSRASLRHLPLAGAAHGTGMFAASVWLPAYFMRSFHLSSSVVGLRLALIMGIAGVAGTFGGGTLVDYLVARTGDARWYSRSCGLFLLVSVPFTLAAYAAADANTALLVFIVPTILNSMILGPVVAAVQTLAGPGRRAMAAALYLFLVNLVASGVGPLVVGKLSDLLSATRGADALQMSLLIVVPITSTWAAIHFLLASRTIREDIAHAVAH